MLVGGLFLFSMMNFGGFLILINKDYLWTFLDTRTGKQFECDKFHTSATDFEKFKIIVGTHRSYYDYIQEDIMKWLNDNWLDWEESSPEWFTAENIAKVPSDMLPVHVLKGMGGISGRKASIAAMEENAKKPEEERGVIGNDLKIKPAAT